MGKHYKIFFLGLMSLLYLASCGSKNDEAVKTDQEEEMVKETLIAMWEAIEKEDLKSYSSYIHPDFTQFGESDSVLRIGKEAELEGIREWLREASNVHTDMIKPMVTVKGDVAWIVYYWQDRGITEEGPFSSKGKSTRIFVKEQNRWQCIHGHYTLLEQN